jgi:protein-tyrosine phosphatase
MTKLWQQIISKITLTKFYMDKKHTILLAVAFSGFIFNVGAQALKVEQVKENTYSLALNSSNSKDKIVWNATPDTWTNSKPVALKSETETLTLSSAHPIFKVEEKKKQPYYVAPRGIKLEGAANFRDLGGYFTQDGKQVKWGKIYRSADVSKLSDGDLKKLADLKVKMVCDLRGPNELETAPDKLPEGAGYINLPAGSENVGGANSFTKYMKSESSADSMMTIFYSRTDHLGAKYKPMFEQLLKLEKDNALMFHCTAGKDRTGVGAAFILYALGVDETQIFQDYELTNEYRKNVNQEAVAKYTSMGVSEAGAKRMMAANPRYLKATFEAIKTQYGSLDKFLEQEMGLTADKKTTLRSMYLY